MWDTCDCFGHLVSGDKSRRGCAALRVYNQVSVCWAHGLQVSALAGKSSHLEYAEQLSWRQLVGVVSTPADLEGPLSLQWVRGEAEAVGSDSGGCHQHIPEENS